MILFLLLYYNYKNTDSIFADDYYEDTIRQNIGGLLIRSIHYSNDIHSYDYDIDYSYADNPDSSNIIGFGRYSGEEIPKDEQLIQIGKWTIFKTSGDRDKDLIFISDNERIKWTEYEISPEAIEQTNLWKKQKINSSLENWDTVSKITKIDENGIIVVLYTYAIKDRKFSLATGKRNVIYRVNLQTGRLEITGVEKI